MKYSIFGQMKICPHVRDKCCNIADEIRISKMWKKRTRPLLTDKIDGVIKTIYNTFNEFAYIQKLDPSLMAVKYVVNQKVPYKH